MIRPILLALLCAAVAPGCSNSEFASGSAAPGKKAKKEQPKEEPDEDPDLEEEKNPKTVDKDEDEDKDDEGDLDEANEKEGELSEEEEFVKKLAGVPVTKVGVNFEDVPGSGDNDYNDAVLCFTGKFKVDSSNVVSIIEQTVTATTFSSSGCNHNVRAEVHHKDGTKETPQTFDSRAPTPVTLKFKVGSKLEVFMKPYSGCNPSVERNMHTAQDAKVQPDLCNNK